MEQIEELKSPKMPLYTLMEYDPLIDSANMVKTESHSSCLFSRHLKIGPRLLLILRSTIMTMMDL